MTQAPGEQKQMLTINHIVINSLAWSKAKVCKRTLIWQDILGARGAREPSRASPAALYSVRSSPAVLTLYCTPSRVRKTRFVKESRREWRHAR